MQQLVVIDYQAMQNSAAAMDLRNRVMPPELKQFDEALTKSGLNDNHDVNELAFALFRPSQGSDALQTVGIAQGQFDTQGILANFRKQKLKATMVRANSIYPMTKTGMVLCFVDPFDHDLRRQASGNQGAGCAGRDGAELADQRSR